MAFGLGSSERIGPDMAREFSRVSAEVGEDPAVRCVIVTGAGPHFMAMMLDSDAIWPQGSRADYAPAFGRLG